MRLASSHSVLSAGHRPPLGPADSTAVVDAGREFTPRPLQVTWEVTQSCTPGKHRRRAHPTREKQELSTAEAFHLIDQVAALRVPLLVLTGGDPLLRPDLLPIVQYACRHSVRTSLTLLSTPQLTREAIFELKEAGLMRAGLWLDGSAAAMHDRFRGPGSYRRTLEAAGWCHEAGLPLQINTTVTRRNLGDLASMIELLVRLDVALWNVFLFPPAAEPAANFLAAEDHEEIFAKLYAASKRVHFQIKTTEGPHYQRYVLQRRACESGTRPTEADVLNYRPTGVNDGKSLVFVNHLGEVFPSRFLPLSGGNITRSPLRDIYGQSPLFLSLRDSSKLKGKCGKCEFRNVCGGSRARAYALTGDLLAEDPSCAYRPASAAEM